VTVAGDVKGGYGVIDSGSEPKAPPKKFTELRPSAQAAILCKDERFRNWLENGIDEGQCVSVVRGYCGIVSRAELDSPGVEQDLWIRLNNEYWLETRYPDQA
jgi:hypothetical protein